MTRHARSFSCWTWSLITDQGIGVGSRSPLDMISPMAMTPGGGRPPSTQPRPKPAPADKPRPPRGGGGRRPVWPRSASISVVRLGVLIGGLVIIADLGALAYSQRTFSADDAAAAQALDELVNYVLFSLLGVLVVRDTGLFYAGVVAGIFGSLLDASVVAAASIVAPAATPSNVVQEVFANNLLIGTVFAGVSGVVYFLVQRWSSGRRSR